MRRTLDYYRDKLGFTGEWTFGDKDGGIGRDDLNLLFAEDREFSNDINNKNHRLPLMWFVNDVDTIYVEFKMRDVEIADSLRTYPYRLREFAYIGINGYYIRIEEGTQDE